MNIYDFDNTIFEGDSSYEFIGYSFLRHPILLIISTFKALFECLKWLFKKSDFGKVKGKLFSFVKYISNLDEYIDEYVLKHVKYIKKFYLDKQKDDDVVISASFDFLIKPFCKYLKIENVIATRYDVKKGCIIGNNCKGKEKVIRFKEKFKNQKVMEAYSDSLSDIPMLNLALKAYIVKGEELIPYVKKV